MGKAKSKKGILSKITLLSILFCIFSVLASGGAVAHTTHMLIVDKIMNGNFNSSDNYVIIQANRRDFDHIGNFNFRVDVENIKGIANNMVNILGVSKGIVSLSNISYNDTYFSLEAIDLKTIGNDHEIPRGPKKATRETLAQIESAHNLGMNEIITGN